MSQLFLEEKIARLQAAHLSGKKFFVLSCVDFQESLSWIFAAFSSPMAIVPISPNLPPEAKRRLLQQLPPGEWVEELPPAAEKISSEKPLTDVWAVLFTSGSSGDPKGVAISGNALQASALAHEQHLARGKISWLLNLPLFHVGGFSIASRAFFLESPIALAGEKFNAKEILSLLRSGKAQGLSLVPTTLRRLLAENPHPSDFQALKVALLGGAPTEKDLIQRALEAGIPLHLTYGMTENASQIATEKLPGTGLIPLPGVEIDFASDEEILLRSPYLATGYYKNGTLLPLPLQNGFFPTGDLGIFSSGKLLIEGRKSDMIISGGVKIFPTEIEAFLKIAPNVDDATVIGLNHPEWGEIVCGVLVGEKVSPDTVKSYLKTRVDPRKIPKEWFILPSIPRSQTGKIQRHSLRQLIETKRNFSF